MVLGLLAASAPTPSKPRVVHVLVALCDNVHQGIVPVPEKIGNGDDPAHNLYWGASYGVKTHFTNHGAWTRLECRRGPRPEILERCIFRHQKSGTFMVADAYQGQAIRRTVEDFLEAASGGAREKISVTLKGKPTAIEIGGAADLIAYVGHDGLMDFSLSSYPQPKDQKRRDLIILACVSKRFFHDAVRAAGAFPLLWTTGLMAPEAYTLSAALEGWTRRESPEAIRARAAAAYAQYQKCGIKAARNLLVSGW